MPAADKVKALILSHVEKDDAQFYSVAMQMAADEARSGHSKLAHDLRELVDRAKSTFPLRNGLRQPTPIVSPRGEISELLLVTYPSERVSDMTLSDDVTRHLQRFLEEQRYREKLRSHGLMPRRKLLLVGPPGCGKTMTARALAGELALPLFTIRLDGLITKFMGETAAKLRLVFDNIRQTRAVYLFDEFDAIGGQRLSPNDVGEMRRVLNSLLQMIEQDNSESLVLAATNHRDLLDAALFRRFDDMIEYDLPTKDLLAALMKRMTDPVDKSLPVDALADQAIGLSLADVKWACDEAVKAMVLQDARVLDYGELLAAIRDRKNMQRA